MDDIVTRLREHHCQNIYCCEVPDQAADEIERLRAENHGLRIRVFTLLKKLEEK